MSSDHENSAASKSAPGLKTGSSLGRWLPLIALAALMALVFAMGWHKYLSFKTIGLNYEALKTFIASNTLTALLTYMLVYIVVVALSLPGGLIMTLAGGLLFGWQLGAPATVVAATIGATLLFLVAKTSFGEALAAKAGPSLAGHTAKPLAYYGAIETLEGPEAAGSVIIEFPTMAEARAWYNSDAYQEARQIRFKGADYRVFLTEGL